MQSLAQTLVRRRLWLVYVAFFLWMASSTLLLPHLTPISVNYFASRAAGVAIRCEDNKRGSDDHITSVTTACATGSAEAARYVSLTSFVSNAMLGLVVSPLAAWMSDSYGRKPFFLASIALYLLPLAWMALYLFMGRSFPFTVFYILNTLKGAVVPMSLVTAAAADVAEPEWRATAFSLLAAVFSASFLVGASAGGLMSSLTAAVTSVACCVMSLAVTFFFMQETVSTEAMAAARSEHTQSVSVRVAGGLHGLLQGMQSTVEVLTRNKLFSRLALVTMANGFVTECLADLIFNYLMITVGFGAEDNSRVLTLLGFLGLPVQGLLLPALLKVMPDKWVLVLALTCSALDMLALSSAPYVGGWVVYAGLVIGAPSSMAQPVISALKSVHAGEDEQGKVQGALYAAKGLAQGVGPLCFSFMFTFFTQKRHYSPEAPVASLAVVMALGAVVAASISVPLLRSSSSALDPDETKHSLLCEDTSGNMTSSASLQQDYADSMDATRQLYTFARGSTERM